MFMFVFTISLIGAEEVLIVQRGDLVGMSTDGGKTWTISQTSTGEQKTGGVHKVVERPTWLLGTMEFFDWGITWADLIVSLAILMMLFAAVYDILSFTAFEKEWVKYLIAIGVALITSVVGLSKTVAVFVMGLIGNSVILGTGLIIGIALLFFVLGSIAKGRMKVFQAKREAMKAKAGYVRAANAIGGLKDIDKAAARDAR